MGTPINDRVKKHRNKKKETPEGIEEIRAQNRVYAKRSRAKKEYKRLTDEKSCLGGILDAHEQSHVERKTQEYRTQLMESKGGDGKYYGEMNEDETREVDILVLKYE